MVKITVKNLQKKVSLCPKEAERLIKKVLRKEQACKGGEITVSLVTDPLIRALNSVYSKKNISTDVLAFNWREGFNKGKIYADIIVSSDTAARNAKFFDTTPEYELRLYIAHGLLHILGYSHNLKRKSAIMRRKESEYAHT